MTTAFVTQLTMLHSGSRSAFRRALIAHPTELNDLGTLANVTADQQAVEPTTTTTTMIMTATITNHHSQ